HRAPVDAELPHVLPEPGVARPAARQEGADGADARGAEGPEPRRDPARGADALGDRLRVLRAATGDVVGGDLHRVPGRGPPRPTGPRRPRGPPGRSGLAVAGPLGNPPWGPGGRAAGTCGPGRPWRPRRWLVPASGPTRRPWDRRRLRC